MLFIPLFRQLSNTGCTFYHPIRKTPDMITLKKYIFFSPYFPAGYRLISSE